MTKGIIRKGQGESALLIHGFCENNWMWNHAIEQLSKDFQVVAIDLPGFGDLADEDVMSMTDSAKYVADILDGFEIDKAVIAGHSMGGYVALSFLQHYPEKVAGISLINSHAAADSLEKSQNRLKTVDFLRQHGSSEFLKLFIKDLLSAQNDNNTDWLNELEEMVGRTPTNSIISALYKMIERQDQRELLKSTEVPVQFLLGTNDKMYNHMEVLEQGVGLSLGDLHLFPSGHLGIKEMPEEYLRALTNFSNFCFHQFSESS